MFGPYRRFPFRGLALVAIGFLLASVLLGGAPASGVAAGFGFALLLPLLMFKMLFVFFLFGSLLRFAGGGRGPWPGSRSDFRSGNRGPWGRYGGPGPRSRHRRRDEYASEDQERWFDRERYEWEESLRQAREEVRKHDNPFSKPPRGFEPPSGGPSDDPSEGSAEEPTEGPKD